MNQSSLFITGKNYEDSGRIDKAYPFYLEAILSENDAYAMYRLGYIYLYGYYVKEDYDKAGYYFGMAYDNGMDVEPYTLIIAGTYWDKKAEERHDNEMYDKAIYYYKAAADQGILFGYQCMGRVYYNLGEYEKSRDCFWNGGDNNPLGYYFIAKLYENGFYLEKSISKAVYYFKKAVEEGMKYENEYGEDDYTAHARKRLRELNYL